jgi:hypothetical protein
MAAQNHARRFDISHAALITLTHMRAAIAQLGASFAGGLAGLANERAEAMLSVAARDTCDLRFVSELMSKALMEDSNLEVDWLYYASRLDRVDERCYCLQRALDINPNNDWTRREIARLS